MLAIRCPPLAHLVTYLPSYLLLVYPQTYLSTPGEKVLSTQACAQWLLSDASTFSCASISSNYLFSSELLGDSFRLEHLFFTIDSIVFSILKQNNTESDVLKIRVSVGGDPSLFSLSLCRRLFTILNSHPQSHQCCPCWPSATSSTLTSVQSCRINFFTQIYPPLLEASPSLLPDKSFARLVGRDMF